MVCGEEKNRNQKNHVGKNRWDSRKSRMFDASGDMYWIGLHAARITQIKKRNVVWCNKKMDWEMRGMAREARIQLWLRYVAGTNRVSPYTGVVSMRLSKVQQKGASANPHGSGTA